jgi:ParB family chromosome partitioning protein
MKLAITEVHPNPDQPRKFFDPEAIAELGRSILAQGLLQAIVVRPHIGQYQIVGGERRWRAHHWLVSQGHGAFAMIEATVRDMDEVTRDIAAIIENMVRQDVTPLEEADAFQRLVNIGLTAEEIAKRTGADTRRVRLRLMLCNLDPSVRKLLEGGQLDRQQATEISRLPDHREQLRIVRLINQGRITGWNSVKHAVELALGNGEEQADIFGALAPAVSEKDVKELTAMERKIESIVTMVSTGWKDGECIVANRVNPDRALLMADKLGHIRRAIRDMERELRAATAQTAAALDHVSSRSSNDNNQLFAGDEN